MKIALISDIHANYEALKLFKDELAQADLSICLGDIIGYYTQVNEVIETLRQLKTRCILGNHDYYLLSRIPDQLNPHVRWGLDYARKIITPNNHQWLANLPLIDGPLIDGQKWLLVHGSPWNPVTDYLFPDNPRLSQLVDFAYDVILFGQTHHLIIKQSDNQLIINPGSIGQPRDITGQSSMVIYDTITKLPQVIRKKFDTNQVKQLAIEQGAEAWIDKHLVNDM